MAIGPVSYPGLSSGLFAASPSGKPARSLFRVLHRHAASTLVEVGGQLVLAGEIAIAAQQCRSV